MMVDVVQFPCEADGRVAFSCDYRHLEEGELIVAGDEWLSDTGWLPTICVGQNAPNPIFPAHRVYRRRVVNCES